MERDVYPLTDLSFFLRLPFQVFANGIWRTRPEEVHTYRLQLAPKLCLPLPHSQSLHHGVVLDVDLQLPTLSSLPTMQSLIQVSTIIDERKRNEDRWIQRRRLFASFASFAWSSG